MESGTREHGQGLTEALGSRACLASRLKRELTVRFSTSRTWKPYTPAFSQKSRASCKQHRNTKAIEGLVQ